MGTHKQRTSPARLRKLLELLDTGKSMLIVMQDSPDPDALAAAGALRFIANTVSEAVCTIVYSGRIGRAENRALAAYLGCRFRQFGEVVPERFDLIAMVDTQPGTGNNALPLEHVPHVVIDHHPIRRATRSSPYTDVRSRYGATSTILYEYLATLGHPPAVPLATALLYGIRSDTQDLGREAIQADVDAFLALYPLANKRMLARIQNASLPAAYYAILARALRNAEVAGDAVFSFLGPLENPDMVSEVADLLLRHEGSNWALCCGVSDGRLLLSLRASSDSPVDCGKTMRRIVGSNGTGGGHYAMAGGQLELGERAGEIPVEALREIRARFRRATRTGDAQTVPLLA